MRTDFLDQYAARKNFEVEQPRRVARVGGISSWASSARAGDVFSRTYTGSSKSPLSAVTAGGATVLASSAAILGVIDAKDEELLQLAPTYNTAAVTTGPTSGLHPAGTAHSVTVDAKPMFTPVFAVVRTVGWVAQWNEMIADPETRLFRPRQLYTGPAQRDVVPVNERESHQPLVG
jgi:hypothetical protein